MLLVEGRVNNLSVYWYS